MYVALSDRAFVLVSTFLCLRTRSTTSMRSLEEVKWRNLNFYNIVDSRLSSKWTTTLPTAAGTRSSVTSTSVKTFIYDAIKLKYRIDQQMTIRQWKLNVNGFIDLENVSRKIFERSIEFHIVAMAMQTQMTTLPRLFFPPSSYNDCLLFDKSAALSSPSIIVENDWIKLSSLSKRNEKPTRNEVMWEIVNWNPYKFFMNER